jgi:Kef-type K+ transport system membrane component KefB
MRCDMESLYILGLVAILAFIAPFFSRKLRMPIVVGEIIFGVIVGTIVHLYDYLGFSINLTNEPLEVLSTLGFVTLMFMVGMENDFDEVRSLSRRERIGTVLIITASFLICILFSVISGLHIIIGLMLGGVSIGVLNPLLREMGIIRTKFGFKVMLLAQLADILAIFLISIAAASTSGWIALLEIIAIPIIFLLVFWLMDVLIWNKPALMSRILDPRDQSEIGTRAALAIMLIFYVLALLIGVEAVIGAFMCGILFSALFKERGALMGKLMTLGYGFLIPIFFIYQGFEVSLLDLFDLWAIGLLVLLLLVSMASRLIPMVLSRYFTTKRTDIVGALVLGTNLSVVVAGVKIGKETGIIDDFMATVMILYGVISCVVFPMVFRKMFTKYLSHIIPTPEDNLEH